MEAYPREIAVRVLTRVLSEGQPLDEALAAVAGEIGGDSRGWLTEVCSGTLRWKGRLDLAIDSTALKKKPTGWLRKMLLVSAYQLVAQERTNPAGVVSETVDAIRKREGEPPAKFANAMLRKIAAHATDWREAPLAEKASPADAARWASLPEWLWIRLMKGYGRDWAKAYATASLERPVIWLRSKHLDWQPDWAKPGPLPGSWEASEGGAIASKKGFAEGECFVQDISSQLLVAEICEDARRELGEHPMALDLCAAPGGKSVGMAWSGLRVTATDQERDPRRMELLRQTVQRVAPEVRVAERRELAALPAQDLVWVDAPCTGTGILRRHPDVRWLRQERELAGLREIQRELLLEAWEKARPGGLVAYSVCSVLPEEGPGAIEAAGLKSRVAREWSLLPQVEPYGDGFFAALLRKPMASS